MIAFLKRLFGLGLAISKRERALLELLAYVFEALKDGEITQEEVVKLRAKAYAVLLDHNLDKYIAMGKIIGIARKIK